MKAVPQWNTEQRLSSYNEAPRVQPSIPAIDRSFRNHNCYSRFCRPDRITGVLQFRQRIVAHIDLGDGGPYFRSKRRPVPCNGHVHFYRPEQKIERSMFGRADRSAVTAKQHRCKRRRHGPQTSP